MFPPDATLDAVLAMLSLMGAGVEHHLHRRGFLKRSWWPVLLALAIVFTAFAVVADGGVSAGDTLPSPARARAVP